MGNSRLVGMSKSTVGYGNPPEHTRFQKGQSGNPRGRPKGSQNLATVLERILREPVTIRENGRTKILTKLEYALEQLAEKATSGDLRALQQLTALVRSAEERAPQEEPRAPLDEADRKVLQHILQRIENTTVKQEENNAADHK